MAKRPLKKCSTSLAIRAMQITALRFHITPIRIAKVTKKNMTTKAGQDMEKEGLSFTISGIGY